MKQLSINLNVDGILPAWVWRYATVIEKGHIDDARYDMICLFHKAGNDDGNDEYCCRIADALIRRMVITGAEVVTPYTTHNTRQIEQIKTDRTMWKLWEHIDEFPQTNGEWEKIFHSLPEQIQAILRSAAVDGIEV